MASIGFTSCSVFILCVMGGWEYDMWFDTDAPRRLFSYAVRLRKILILDRSVRETRLRLTITTLETIEYLEALKMIFQSTDL